MDALFIYLLIWAGTYHCQLCLPFFRPCSVNFFDLRLACMLVKACDIQAKHIHSFLNLTEARGVSSWAPIGRYTSVYRKKKGKDKHSRLIDKPSRFNTKIYCVVCVLIFFLRHCFHSRFPGAFWRPLTWSNRLFIYCMNRLLLCTMCLIFIFILRNHKTMS